MTQGNRYSFFFFLLFSALSIFAKVPAGHYRLAEGKKDSELQEFLSKVTRKGHKELKYDDLWWLYSHSDTLHLPNGDIHIWDLYSTRGDRTANHYFIPGKAGGQCGSSSPGSGEGICYNREHSVPYSWFAPPKEKDKKGRETNTPMYKDAFHLYPTDRSVNSKRNNNPYGEVALNTQDKTSNGSMRGSARDGLGYSGIVFEPIDAYKGDLARTYFYMATRYMDLCGTWGGDMFGTDESGFRSWAIKMLLDWHRKDPVSQKEKNRNKAISQHQGNRNPFIDYPELAEFIWGDKKGQPWTSGEPDAAEDGKTDEDDNLIDSEIEDKLDEKDATLKENFDLFTETGGNDGKWKGSGIANKQISTEDIFNLSHGESSWSFESAYKGKECVKIGISKQKGSATTPNLNLEGDGVLFFRAGAWDGDGEKTVLKVELVDGGSLEKSEVTLKRGQFSQYKLKILDANANSKIRFEGTEEAKSRFFLDDVLVKKEPKEEPTTTGLASSPVSTDLSVIKQYSTGGKIFFEAKAGESVELYSPVGILLYKSTTQAGLNSIESPSGIVIIKVGRSVEKVFVK